MLDRLIQGCSHNNWKVFFTIGFFCLAAYSFMLASPFKTLDDDFSIVKNQEIRDLKNIPGFFHSTYFKKTTDYYRPLVYVTYALEYHAFRLNYFFYNFDNVVLHILNAWLVFCLVLLLLHDRRRAFLVSFLFAIHPIHWEAVGNVSGRAILLCACFVLCGFIAFLRFAKGEGRRWLVIAAACYALGLLSKESAGVLILTATAFWFLVHERERKPRPQELVWLSPFVLLAGGYFGLRHTLDIAKTFTWPSTAALAFGLTSFFKGVLIYIRLLVFPVGLHFDRALPLFARLTDPGLWLTMAVWVGLGYLFFRIHRRLSGLAIFCIGWFFIELLPVSQIVTTIGVYPGAISIAEHFLYLAAVPACCLMVMGAERIYGLWTEKKIVSAKVFQGAFLGFFLFFFLTLVQQNIYASNEYVMLRDSLNKSPLNSRLQYSLGMVYVKAGNYARAVEHFREAVKIDGLNRSYHIALGRALADNGEYLAAAREYEAVPPRKEADPLLETNKAEVYRLLVAEYEKKIMAEPQNVQTRFALGIFHSKTGDNIRATQDFGIAVELDPQRYDALFNLAVTFESLKAWGQAFEAYQKLSSINDPANVFRKAAADRLGYLSTLMKAR